MMGSSFGEALRAARRAAFEEAVRFLKEVRFAQVRDRRWAGRIGTAQHGVEIELPEDFPDTLPTVFLAEQPKGLRIAHVESNRKICLASESATLVDAERVADVIREALERADAVLSDEAGHQRAEIQREFIGYWDGRNHGVVTICPPDCATGEVHAVQFGGDAKLLVAADATQAKAWLEATGQPAGARQSGWLMRLDSFLPLPKPGKKLRLGEVLELLEREIPAADYAVTTAWLRRQALPALIVFSSPIAGSGGRAVYGVMVPRPEDHGFRAGAMPGEVGLARARGEPIVPVSVQRADPEFLLVRGGGVARLREKTVLLAGCGSVGSHLAVALSSMGVGRLVLVDPEALGFENTHRHVLGAAQVGEKKADALRTLLRQRFPHQVVDVHADTVEHVLERDERIFKEVDVVVLALGAETIERRLSKLLATRVRVVHAWLEPLGVGGHVVASAVPGSAGCFCCLFRHDKDHGLVNQASLVEPNQKFQRSLGGCAGSFTPFGVLDAQRVAIEAAREVGRVLAWETHAQPRLTTWVGSKVDLVAAGVRLSPRGEALQEGCLLAVADFVRADCDACGSGHA
ncbi:MAG: ThiF family adenylyltransferase [Planctomycetota bacterium]